MNGCNFQVESIGHDIRSTQFSKNGCCDTLTHNDYKDPAIICYAIENHPCDSRVTMTYDGVVQTLNARMGTGGNNTPFVLMENNVQQENPVCVMASSCVNAEMTDGVLSPTIMARAGTGGNQLPLVVLKR